MGGTFNPPHEGHAICARTALRRLQLDQLWWIVTPGNPLKSGAGLPSLEERMAA
jgi:nicotinate-nucleotide adenylyltransferase